MNSLTIHSVVRNEPFIYYAIKSVYEEADVIMLCDTGSYDKYTLIDIERLLDEDIDKKIQFTQTPIDVDQTTFTHGEWKKYAEMWKGKFVCGHIRQQQIDSTKTDFFMQVDGDEVHYGDTVKRIKDELLPLLTGEYLWSRIPFYMFCDTDHILGWMKAMGRVFRTDSMYITADFPEMHYVKSVGKYDRSKFCLNKNGLKPFAHFETYLKPWRRPSLENTREVKDRTFPLPDIMSQEPYYMERFKCELQNSSIEISS